MARPWVKANVPPFQTTPDLDKVYTQELYAGCRSPEPPTVASVLFLVK
jgi:hypothetical protein